MNLSPSQVGKTTVTVLLAVMWYFAFSLTSASLAAAGNSIPAQVGAIEGNAQIVGESDQAPKPLHNGDAVESWKMISTDARSKLLLRWGGGLLGSMGEYSSIILSSAEGPGGEIPNVNLIEGALRVASDRQAGLNPTAFVLTTPAALIQPDLSGEPVDFIVEVYEPSKTVVTVVAGKIRVKRDKAGTEPEEVVSACQSVYVETEKAGFERVPVPAEALSALAGQTTIAGTMVDDLGACGPVAAGEPPPPLAQMPTVSHTFPEVPEYYFEDEGTLYDFPYDDIRVSYSPTYTEGVVVFIPGLGEFFVPLSPGWVLEPDVCQFYVRRVLIDYAFHFDRGYYDDILRRIQELNRVIYLAQLSGNYGLLWDAQQQLAYLRIRSDWAARRIHRLDGQIRLLDQEQHRYSGRLPAGANLYNTIFSSFNSSSNRGVVEKFRDRLGTERTVEKQLAGLAGQELVRIRSRVAGERDPRKRLALSHELGRIRNTLEQGGVPIPAKKSGVKDLVTRLAKEGDPSGRVQLQQQVLGQLDKESKGVKTVDVLTQDKLKNLGQGIHEFPNRNKRPDLEQRFVELEKSVASRNEAATARVQQETQIKQMGEQAANEKDPQKREQLLKQLQQLTVPLMGRREPTTPLPVVQPPQRLLPTPPGGGDAAKKAAIEKKLQEQRLRQEQLRQEGTRQEQVKPEQARQHQLQQDQVRRQEELKRQADIKRGQEEEARKKVELRRLEEEKKKQADVPRQQQLHQDQARQEQIRQQQLQEQQVQKERIRQQQVQEQQLQQEKLRQERTSQEQLKQQQIRQEQVQRDQNRQQQLKQEQNRQQQLRQEQNRQQQLKQEQNRQQQLRPQQIQQDQIRQQQIRRQQEEEQKKRQLPVR